jgi:hypothetical protein
MTVQSHSVGKCVGTIGIFGHRCWEVVDHIRVVFYSQLRPLIRDRLRGIFASASLADMIVITVYMVGRTSITAAPTVLFISENGSYRRQARKIIKDSGMLQPHCGWKTADAARDPVWGGLMQPLATENNDGYLSLMHDAALDESFPQLQLPSAWTGFNITPDGDSSHPFYFEDDHRYNFPPHEQSKASATTLPSQSRTTRDQAAAPWVDSVDTSAWNTTVLFDSVSAVASRGMRVHVFSPTGYSNATANLIHMHHRNFYMVPAHCFLEKTDTSIQASTQYEDGFDIDSDGDGDGDGSDTSLVSGTEADPAILRAPNERMSLDSSVSTEVPGNSYASVPLQNLRKLGELAHISVDADWALIEVSKVVNANLSQSSGLDALHVASTASAGAIVQAHTASEGILMGTMYGTPSDIRLPGSRSFQEVYSIKFDHGLDVGDCGSVVLDATGQVLYGHIVYGCRNSGFAYVMAAHHVLSGMREMLSDHAERLSSRIDTVSLSSRPDPAPSKHTDGSAGWVENQRQGDSVCHIHASLDSDDMEFRCALPGCGMVYKRLADFTRHYKGSHAVSHPIFWCPIPSCERSAAFGARPISRKDKLMEHLRRMHG